MTKQVTSKPPASKPKPKSRPSQTQPFDPEELSRKLYAVLADQKAYAERKKRAKAKAEADRRALVARKAVDTRAGNSDKASLPRKKNEDASTQTPTSRHDSRRSQDGRTQTKSPNPDDVPSTEAQGYRHIPQVAASQFARTTKAEDASEKQVVHRLSRPAMKFHLEGPNASREMADVRPETAPIEQAKALRRAQSMRERLYERNQFQHASTLQATLEADEQLGNAPQCRSFDGQKRPRWVENGDDTASRRISTGAFLWWEPNKRFSGGFDGVVLAERPESGDYYELAAQVNEHRVDWTQSDETAPIKTIVPAPRKQESRWNLRGRMVNFHKHGKDDKQSVLSTDKTVSDDSSRSSRSGFFARFKR
ncbi:hypothetical protein HJFPF1_06375 [Paramyrothecium foliicola]|nr:hypothetical protein HJFPF1_06375 [Paramyrothecium foliicola]